MKRLTAGLGVSGLGLMSAVAVAAGCRLTAMPWETAAVLFFAGIVLFVLGGSGYSRLER